MVLTIIEIDCCIFLIHKHKGVVNMCGVIICDIIVFTLSVLVQIAMQVVLGACHLVTGYGTGDRPHRDNFDFNAGTIIFVTNNAV